MTVWPANYGDYRKRPARDTLIEIGYHTHKGQILVMGDDVERFVSLTDAATLRVVLAFRESAEGGIATSEGASDVPALLEVIRLADEAGISYVLTPGAEAELRARQEFLNHFDAALRDGRAVVEGRATHLRLPSEFTRTLKPYQESSVAHLTKVPFAANFSVPGSGKTTMVLAAYAIMRKARAVDGLFVIGPRASFDPWEEEFRGCFERTPRALRIIGTREVRRSLLRVSDQYELFLISYQMVANELERLAALFEARKLLLVIDESHHIKRGVGGVWYDAARALAPRAARRVVLSGTPAPNSVEDIIPQFDILWPGMEGVTRQLAAPTQEESLKALRTYVRPLYVRVRKKDLGLSKKKVTKVVVQPGAVQKRIYDAIASKALVQISNSLRGRTLVRDLRKASMMRLIQASSNPTLLVERSEEFKMPPLDHVNVEIDRLIRSYSSFEAPKKLAKATQMAAALAGRGQKTIIWTSFIHNVHLLTRLLAEKGISCEGVTGEMPIEDDEADAITRDEKLRAFRERKDPMVLVATIPSIGESVSLHKRCENAIYVDRTFNCGLYMQSMDRIHRIGMLKGHHAHYYHLIGPGTIDEVIDRRLREKMGVMHRLLDDDIGVLDLDVPEDLFSSDADDDDARAVYYQLREAHKS